MMYRMLLGLWFFMGGVCILFAQEEAVPFKVFITQEVNNRLEAKYPDVKARRERIEQFIDSVTAVGIPASGTLHIPVVFHLFYHDDHQYVSRAQVLSQLAALNRDFNAILSTPQSERDKQSGFFDLRADLDIHFCLATYQYKGRKMEGIHYISSDKAEWPADHSLQYDSTGGTAAWNPAHLVNIWVAPLKDGVSGFAQYPGGPSETDGIVIDYRFFGQMGTAFPAFREGKTLSHLMGNYFHLHDLWSNTKQRCMDDGVADTPIHNSANIGCTDYWEMSLCSGNPVEMTINLMDTVVDSCMYMFTKGQKNRLRASLLAGGARYGLISERFPTLCKTSFFSESTQAKKPIFSLDGPGPLIHIEAYPNPTKDQLFLKIQSKEEGPLSLSIYTRLGQLISLEEHVLSTGMEVKQITTRNWLPGVYICKLGFGEEVYSIRFIKE